MNTGLMNAGPVNAERLLELYDRVADAPDAVERLRRFVLDLAVRGRLVPQDPSDEPAEELLKRIEAEKKRMVREGEIRKPRQLSNGNDLDTPFKIPESWRWCRLDNVGAIIGGGTPRAGDPDNFAQPGEGIPWLTPADLGAYPNRYIDRGARDLSEKGLATSSATLMPTGTVLFTSRAPIGYVAIAANPIATNQGFKSIVPYVAECSPFVAITMQAFAPAINEAAPGTTFKEVSGKIVAGISFPLPPLAEQHRIVARVDELMSLLARLEAARTQRESTRDRLTAASLARLTTTDATPEDHRRHTRFALDNLPALTTRPHQIKQLRQTILNLAVRGMLVEQDPGDEGQTDELTETGEPGWRRVKLDQLLSEKTRNGYSRRPDDAEDGVPILRISAGTARIDGVVAEEEHKLISGIDDATRSQYGLREGDLLACRFNGNKEYVGRLTLFTDYLNLNPIYPDKLIRVRVDRDLAEPAFVRLAFESDLIRDQIEEFSATTVGNWGISATNLRQVIVPLPLLAEQRRIVAKVDELMALCDGLEEGLGDVEGLRMGVLQGVVEDA